MREIAYVPTHLKQSLIFICFPLTVTARVKEKGKEKVSETRTSTLKLNIEKSKNRRREEGRSIGPSVASSFRAGWLKSSLAYLDPSSCRYESDPLGKGRRRRKTKTDQKTILLPPLPPNPWHRSTPIAFIPFPFPGNPQSSYSSFFPLYSLI